MTTVNLFSEVNIAELSVSERVAIYDLARKVAIDDVAKKGGTLVSPELTREYLQSILMGLEHEVFGIVFLDNSNAVIEYNEMFRGTIDAAAVYPREVVKAALKVNAAACILCHNHPGGSLEPSQADRAITSKIQDCLGTLDIRVLDHFIITKTGTTSFAERGYI